MRLPFTALLHEDRTTIQTPAITAEPIFCAVLRMRSFYEPSLFPYSENFDEIFPPK